MGFRAERLASAREESESEVRAMKSDLGVTAAKFGAGLASLAVLQQGWQVFGFGIVGGGAGGSRIGETVKGGSTIIIRAVAGGGLVTPPTPWSPSTDVNGPWERRSRSSSSRARGVEVSSTGTRRGGGVGYRSRGGDDFVDASVPWTAPYHIPPRQL